MTEREQERAACSNCLFWERNPPQPIPERPPEHYRFLGIRISRDPFEIRYWEASKEMAELRNESGQCRRLPRFQQHHEHSWCGEYRAAATEIERQNARAHLSQDGGGA